MIGFYESKGVVGSHDDVFDAAFTEAMGDLEFVRRLLRERRARRVAELGCGTGRLAIPLARDGYEVIGIDAAPAMLARARANLATESAATRKRVRWVEADSLPAGLELDAVLCAFRTFELLQTNAAREGFLRTAAEALRPRGGVLVIHVVPPNLAELAKRPLPQVAFDRTDAAGRRLRASLLAVRIDESRQLVDERWEIESWPAHGEATRETCELTWRFAGLEELRRMFAACGLREAGFQRSFHDPGRDDGHWVFVLAP